MSEIEEIKKVKKDNEDGVEESQKKKKFLGTLDDFEFLGSLQQTSEEK